jgi:hypothetical protein
VCVCVCVYIYVVWKLLSFETRFSIRTFFLGYCTEMTGAAVWCFKVEDVKSRNRFSRPETMRSISQKYQNLFLKRGTWDPDEDQKLRAYIKRHRIWNWNEMPRAAGNC